MPGAEHAIAEERRFLEYLLSPEHPRGQHKARVFAALGYDRSNWAELRARILADLPYVEGRFTKMNLANPPEELWEATVRIESPAGSADVTTAWGVHEGEPTRFLTAYPA